MHTLRWLPVALATIAGALAGAIIVTSAGLARIAYVPMPFYDYWHHVLPSENWTYLYRTHNEHFVILAVPFWWADTTLFAAKGYFAVGLSWLFLALSAGIAAWAVFRDRTQLVLVAALAFAFFFSGRQIENLVFPLQLQFTGAVLTAVIAIAAAAHGAWRSSMVAAVASPLFAGVGIAAAPAVAVIGYCQKLPLRWLALIVATWLAVLALYVFSVGHAVGIAHASASPLDALKKIPIFLAVPIVSPFTANLTATLIVGLVLLCLVAGIAARYCLRRDGDAPQLAALGFMLFGVLALSIVAVGRSSQSGDLPGLRYAIFAAPVYIGLAAMIPRASVLGVVSVLMTGALLLEQQSTWRHMAASFEDRAASVSLWLRDQSNLSILVPIYPSPENIAPQIDYLRRTKKSVFAD